MSEAAQGQPLPAYFSQADIDIDSFHTICSQTVDMRAYPHAAGVAKKIVIYDGATVREALKSPTSEAAIRAEMTHCLSHGPGVFAVTGAYEDVGLIEDVSVQFAAIIADEKAAGKGQGDHFGSNERIWNSLQKLCLRAPELFVPYYGNAIVALASQAWLGPNYQMTAQVNVVKPGSSAQAAHRDYHLGFQSAATVAQYPAHAQVMSQYLTLQGAVVHSDMPLETGPTLFLPFSQQFKPGYMAYSQPAFNDYFSEHKVHIPFKKGDAVFFNPSLHHGAGTNQSTGDRVANLVQVSSAFGLTMEAINRTAMIEAVYPVLLAQKAAGSIDPRLIRDSIAVTADGYSFPTNLDSDPPVGGNAPETAQQMMQRALDAELSLDELKAELTAYAIRRQA